MIRPLDMLRMLLGAVLVVTALQYFLPAMLDFLPAATWDDPMAARLMTAFDRSGLLAVAKFIHLVAGALLLVNRASPFALAALMPVNLCGMFIALFIEAEALVGLLAVATVTLNALLMLAYLHYYRGVLDSRHLADGERPEPGLNFESVYVNPLSGAPQAAYVAAAIVLLAALAFYWWVVPFANGTTGLVTLLVPVALLGAGWARAAMRKG